MAKKRGEIEIQFNWILILVAGALIFIFFFSLIRWASNSSQASSSATTSKYLDSIFTGSSVVKSTVNKIPYVFERIDFTCDDYVVDQSNNRRNIRNKILFAPTRIEKSELVTWSVSWDVPFRVTNFLFVSSPKIRYIFISSGADNEIYKFFNKSFPRELNGEFYDPSTNLPPESFQDLNNFKVRFIFVGYNNPDISYVSNLKRMGGEDVTALVINGDSMTESLSLGFYRKSEPANAVSFVEYPRLESLPPTGIFGAASLIGAVFSERPDDFICNMKKASDRLVLISKIYRNKAEVLSSSFGDCSGYYVAAMSGLDLIPASLDSAYLAIKDANQQLQRKSCPLIY